MIRAALVAFAALALAHLQGWRMNVAFLSGTVPATSDALMTGLLYAVCWFTGVVVAPVLLVSGIILRIVPRSVKPAAHLPPRG